jgi:hypothetical protein
MVKRILLLGLAALAVAVFAPSLGTQSVTGTSVAQAQEAQDPADPADPPEAQDPADPADPADPPEAPDQGDAPEDDEGSGDADETDDEEETDQPAPVSPPATPAPAPVSPPAPSAPSERSQGQESQESGNSGRRSGSERKQTTAPVPTHQNTANVQAATDTATVPQGGVQAGAGGTADAGSPLALLLGSGALGLALTAGGVSLRRRSLES